MGDSMTCITFQYPVIRYNDTSSSITSNNNAVVDNMNSNNSNTGNSMGIHQNDLGNGKTNNASSTSHKRSNSTTSSSNTNGKTAEQFLHDKVALLCDSIAREWKCSIHSTPMKLPAKVSSLVDQQHHSNLPDKPRVDKSDSSSSNAVLRIIYSVTITGPFHAVMNCKNTLIKRNPSQTVITINTIRNIILTPSGEMKPIVKKRMDDLKQATGTQITCLEVEKSSGSTAPALPVILNIEIVGELDSAERARLLCLALLDELFGLSVMQISVNPKYHALLAGRKREALNTIMHQTETNFYFPLPFTVLNPVKQQVPGSSTVGEVDTYQNTIYITGEADNIQEASKRYLALVKSLESRIITKHIPCLHRKLDWLYTFRKEKIRKIMTDNAVDVSFPALGSASNMIAVMGTQKNLVERAIRSVKQVVCDCYLASIQTGNAVESAEQFVRFCSDVGPTLTRTNALSGVEIMINRNIIEIYGTDVQTKQAYQDLTSCEFVKIRDTKFQIELSLEHRDFINGKKNGKINRITKISGCRISFQENHLDINMMIDLYSAIPSCLLMGISMLEEELPAEMSFHIPETYHKRIIGVGGKNIQKIMKRFGVYVKFSNLEEYEQLGGYYENADNVICRTPSKNAENLRDLKSSIVEAVNATDLLETIDSLDGLPRQLSHWYCGANGKNIAAAHEFRVRIYLPDKESGVDLIGLEGVESSFGHIKEVLKDSIPLLSDFQVPGTSAVLNLIASPEFLDLKKKFRADFHMVVWIATSPPDTEFDFSFFLIHPKTCTHENYEEAKKMIVNLFSEQNVPFSHVARSESYANLNTQVPYDSFQHFNSKLLAPVTGGKPGSSGPPSAGERDSASLRPAGGGGFGGIFAASNSNSGSVQDIRSLFDDAPASTGNQGATAPPGLLRSTVVAPAAGVSGATPSNPGPDLRPKSNSVIARPVNSTTLRRPLNEKTDFLRHSASLSRPTLTMPDLATISVSKSSSMTDIIQTTLNDTTPAPSTSIWGGSAFSKSLSSSAIIQDRGGPNFGKPHNDYGAMVSPTDIEFDQKMEDQVQALDKQNSDESDRISDVLESIDHIKYLPNFIEHEIDYQTFLSLEDADLKELGIKALGSRKKILSVIKELAEKEKESISAASKQKSPDQRLINKGFEF